MTRAVIGGEKIHIEGQPTNINKIVYTKILSVSLISVIYISVVLRIDKKKHYTLSRYCYYHKRLDWTLFIYLYIVIKSIWWLLKIIFLDNQKLEFCIIQIPKP